MCLAKLPRFIRILAGAATAGLTIGIAVIASNIYLFGHILPPQAPAQLASTAAPAISPPTAAAPAAQPFNAQTYVADATKGAQIAAKCKACHGFNASDPNKTGPNLWNIVGRKPGSQAGFSYSTAMTAHNQSTPIWTTEALNTYLENPKATVPGNKMAFAGIKDPAQRADLIAYLATLK